MATHFSLGHEPSCSSLSDELVTAEWKYDGGLVEFTVGSTPNGEPIGYFSGELDLQPKDSEAICWGYLNVHPEYRQQGVASRLLGALAYTALKQGIGKMHGHVESQHTLRIMSNLFGEDAISYSDCSPDGAEDIYLPMTTTQAITSLERAELFERDTTLENREIGLSVSIDMRIPMLHKLEVPVFVGPPADKKKAS